MPGVKRYFQQRKRRNVKRRRTQRKPYKARGRKPVKKKIGKGHIMKLAPKKPAGKFMAKYPLNFPVLINNRTSNSGGDNTAVLKESTGVFTDGGSGYGFNNLNSDVFNPDALGGVTTNNIPGVDSTVHYTHSNLYKYYADSIKIDWYLESVTTKPVGIRLLVLQPRLNDDTISASSKLFNSNLITGAHFGYYPISASDATITANDQTNPGRSGLMMTLPINMYDYKVYYDESWILGGTTDDQEPDRFHIKRNIPINKYITCKIGETGLTGSISPTRVYPGRIQVIALCCDMTNDYDTGANAFPADWFLPLEVTGITTGVVRIDSKSVYT